MGAAGSAAQTPTRRHSDSFHPRTALDRCVPMTMGRYHPAPDPSSRPAASGGGLPPKPGATLKALSAPNGAGLGVPGLGRNPGMGTVSQGSSTHLPHPQACPVGASPRWDKLVGGTRDSPDAQPRVPRTSLPRWGRRLPGPPPLHTRPSGHGCPISPTALVAGGYVSLTNSVHCDPPAFQGRRSTPIPSSGTIQWHRCGLRNGGTHDLPLLTLFAVAGPMRPLR